MARETLRGVGADKVVMRGYFRGLEDRHQGVLEASEILPRSGAFKIPKRYRSSDPEETQHRANTGLLYPPIGRESAQEAI